MEVLKGSLLSWAKENPRILGILLVGSCARGDFRPDSDIDFVILSEDKGKLLAERQWTELFGQIESQSEENWGVVVSLRTKYKDGPEVEFGIAGLDWASDPIDKGTAQVLRGGAKIIWDPKRILGNLLDKVKDKI